jgi:hypothetical protein
MKSFARSETRRIELGKKVNPPPPKRQRLIPERVELLIEHPFADRKWMLAKELPDEPHPVVWKLQKGDRTCALVHCCELAESSRSVLAK